MFEMFGLMGAMWFGWLVIVGFVVVYVLAEVKAMRGGKRPPMLGARALLGMFATVCFQLVVAGLAIVVAYLLDDGIGRSAMKSGVGLVLGGLLSGLMPAYFLKMRCAIGGPEGLKSKVLGINAGISGTVFVALLTIACVALINDDDVAALIGAMIIYLGASMAALLPLTSPAQGGQKRPAKAAKGS